MYADRVASGSKRSIRDRLDGDLSARGPGRNLSHNPKRQRRNEDKWEHDLYEDVKGPQVSKPAVGSRDLRLKLQRKASRQSYQGGKQYRVPDLREKLSGLIDSRQANADPPKAKVALSKAPSESVKPIKKSSNAAAVSDSKKVSTPASSSKKTHKKSDSSVDAFLSSLGLEKYSIQFQAEEVDMAALLHMNDDDLKALGVPMGPRKKIILALDSRA